MTIIIGPVHDSGQHNSITILWYAQHGPSLKNCLGDGFPLLWAFLGDAPAHITMGTGTLGTGHGARTLAGCQGPGVITPTKSGMTLIGWTQKNLPDCLKAFPTLRLHVLCLFDLHLSDFLRHSLNQIIF
jgi:hypothetical protein